MRESARKEFDIARYETDPLIIARLIVVGNDCVRQVKIKFVDAGYFFKISLIFNIWFPNDLCYVYFKQKKNIFLKENKVKAKLETSRKRD